MAGPLLSRNWYVEMRVTLICSFKTKIYSLMVIWYDKVGANNLLLNATFVFPFITLEVYAIY